MPVRRHTERQPIEGVVPAALLGMPLVATGCAMLTAALGWWALVVAAVALTLIVVLVAFGLRGAP